MTVFLEDVVVAYLFDETGTGQPANEAKAAIRNITEVNSGTPSSDGTGVIGRSRIVVRGGSSNQHFPSADQGASDPTRIDQLIAAGGDGFAAEVWIQIGVKTPTTFLTFASKQTTGNSEWALRYDTTTDRPEVAVINNAPAAFIVEGTSQITGGNPGTYTQIGLDYSDVNNTLRLIVDGAEDGTPATTSGTFAGTTAPFSLCGESGIGLFHDGQIDNFYLFNRALTDQEWSDRFNGGSPPGFGSLSNRPLGARQRPRRRRKFIFVEELQTVSGSDDENFLVV